MEMPEFKFPILLIYTRGKWGSYLWKLRAWGIGNLHILGKEEIIMGRALAYKVIDNGEIIKQGLAK